MTFNFQRDVDKKVHFIGIGGVNMSALAAILIDSGYKVSGSDVKDSPALDKLRNIGVDIYVGHNSSNIKNVDIIVCTAAISKENPEYIYAVENNIPLYDRAVFLGLLMDNYKNSIAIAGTHGKTTCTSMFSHIALQELDPTIMVGGDLDAIGGNLKIGSSDIFITEACEFNRSFLNFRPNIAVILNIDADHLDCYKDIDDITETFRKFASSIPQSGYLIGNGDDNRVVDVLSSAKCNIITYGLNEKVDITAKNISYDKRGCATFDVINKGENMFTVTLSTPGEHNILNALAAISVGLIFNISNNSMAKALYECKGAHKRFEYKGEYNGITVIDDYAHHPTEIKATLNTAKKIDHNRIITVFQPHTYTRTKTLFDDFTTCFANTDELVLMDIYAAREPDTGLVSSKELGDAIRATGVNCVNVSSHSDAVEYLKRSASSGDVLLTVGAGDVVIVGEQLLQE